MNGQVSFYNGSDYLTTDTYGIFGSYFYSLDTGLKFTLNLGQNNTANLYCVSVTDTNYAVYSYLSYKNLLTQKDILKIDTVFTNGEHIIDTSIYDIPVGTYKLIALVGENTFYEWYFVYSPDGFVRSVGNYSQIVSLARVYEYLNKQNGQVLMGTTDTINYVDNFSYTGSFSTQEGIGFTRVRLQLGTWLTNFAHLENSSFYVFDIADITFNTTLAGIFSSASFANVALRNSTTNETFFLGTINNLTRSTQVNNNYNDSYVFYFPSSVFSSPEDTLELIFDFNNTLAVGSTYDYSLRVGKINFYGFKNPLDYSDAENAMNALGNASDELGNVEKPEISSDDLDISQYVSPSGIAQASALIAKISSYSVIGAILGLVAVFCLVAYLLYGKRGG